MFSEVPEPQLAHAASLFCENNTEIIKLVTVPWTKLVDWGSWSFLTPIIRLGIIGVGLDLQALKNRGGGGGGLGELFLQKNGSRMGQLGFGNSKKHTKMHLHSSTNGFWQVL